MSRKNRQAEIEQRRKKVSANLLGGLTYRQMAESLDVAVGTVAADVKIILGRLQKEQMHDVEKWRTLEVTRIDRALNAIWDKVVSGNLPEMDRFIKLMERRARLLGLDMPTQMGIEHTGGIDLDAALRKSLDRAYGNGREQNGD